MQVLKGDSPDDTTYLGDHATVDVTAISSGTIHVVTRKSNGTVWSWGDNDSGQLGDNTTTTSHLPVKTVTISGITAVSAGQFHTLALKDDGTVWSWGRNDEGQIGDNTYINRDSPVKIDFPFVLN